MMSKIDTFAIVIDTPTLEALGIVHDAIYCTLGGILHNNSFTTLLHQRAELPNTTISVGRVAPQID